MHEAALRGALYPPDRFLFQKRGKVWLLDFGMFSREKEGGLDGGKNGRHHGEQVSCPHLLRSAYNVNGISEMPELHRGS